MVHLPQQVETTFRRAGSILESHRQAFVENCRHCLETCRAFLEKRRSAKTDPDDPIFENIACVDPSSPADQPTVARILHVWQNHGLQLDRVPEGFKLLATSYLCRNQMMVKRSEGQLIYTVQFHLEKSFEDWNKSRTRWEHPNESRDGRILFENFLTLATR